MLSASRDKMIGSSLYLVGIKKDSNEYEEGASPCQMCRKLIINAGINTVYARINKTEYAEFDVEDWINQDDLLDGKMTY